MSAVKRQGPLPRPRPTPGPSPVRRPRPPVPQRVPPWRPNPRPVPSPRPVPTPRLPVPGGGLGRLVPLLPLIPIIIPYILPDGSQPPMPNPGWWRPNTKCDLVGGPQFGSPNVPPAGSDCISGQVVQDDGRGLAGPLPEYTTYGYWNYDTGGSPRSWVKVQPAIPGLPETVPMGDPVVLPDPAFAPSPNPSPRPRPRPRGEPDPGTPPNLEAGVGPEADPFNDPDAPYGRAPNGRPMPYPPVGWQFGPDLGGRTEPRGREPPKQNEKERKLISRSKRIAIALFGALDTISEFSEIVDAFFEALPEKTRKRWKCDRKFFGLDSAGQYGIDNADCKARALWHNWDAVDFEKAIQGIIKNAVNDAAVGAVHGAAGKYEGNAFSPAYKALDEWLDDFIQKQLDELKKLYGKRT